ncbi:glycosyltransferase family 39 protein [Candidatus Aerophobetes bacterium]|nr:glycosyltransferase family 39 protein [Candidatus Aerophobetes bacterium]
MKNSDKKLKHEFFISREWFLVVFLLVICLYLFVFKLGDTSLWETDEPIYGDVARGILRFGDWITLRFNYREWFDKPPLYFWFTALFYRFFGWNEFTTRITSSLFGMTHVVLVYFLGRVLFNKRVGFFSALILATSLQFIVQSRLALVDVPLSFFISLSFLFFYLGYTNPDRRNYYILSAASMGFATLTKGPIGFLLPGFIILIYLTLTRNLHRLKAMRVPWMVLIFLAIAAPWYIIEFLRHGWIFVEQLFFLRMVTRFATPFEGHTGPVYYYFAVLILGFFPWSSFLPLAFFHFLRRSKDKTAKEREKHFFLLIWIALIFIFFSLSQSKLPGYIFPLYPACALSVGWLWDKFATSKLPAQSKGLYISFGFFFVIVLALMTALTFIGKTLFPDEYALFGNAVLLAIFGLLGAGVFSFVFIIFKRKIFLSLLTLVAGMCIFLWILLVHILPFTEVFKPTKFFAHEIKSVIQPGEKIVDYPVTPGHDISFNCSLVYYSEHPVLGVSNVENLKELFSSGERVYAVMDIEDYHGIKEELEGISLYTLNKRGGKILLSNKQN